MSLLLCSWMEALCNICAPHKGTRGTGSTCTCTSMCIYIYIYVYYQILIGINQSKSYNFCFQQYISQICGETIAGQNVWKCEPAQGSPNHSGIFILLAEQGTIMYLLGPVLRISIWYKKQQSPALQEICGLLFNPQLQLGQPKNFCHPQQQARVK